MKVVNKKYKILHIIIVSFLCLALVGCMPLGYRFGEDSGIEPGPYPGLRITGEIIEQCTHDAETAGMIIGMWFYWVPDIPLSFCLYTICLPYDLMHLNDEEDCGDQRAYDNSGDYES